MLVVEYSGLLVVEQHILIFFISKGKRACFESQYHVSAVVKYRYTYILSRSELVLLRFRNFCWRSVSLGFFWKNLGFGFGFSTKALET